MWGAKLIEWANGMNDKGATTDPQGMAGLFDPPYTNVHVSPIKGERHTTSRPKIAPLAWGSGWCRERRWIPIVIS